MLPAAAFLGLAKSGFPFFSLSLFNLSKTVRDIKTSPRTSISISFLSFVMSLSGIEFMVLRFCVISSPTVPFPLVEPRMSSPSLYSRLTANPSIFNSTTYSYFSVNRVFAILLSNSLNSSSEYVFSRLNIGTECVTVGNPPTNSSPILCVGDVGVMSSGYLFSSSFNSLMSIS
ncbi:hypothetical protein ES703_41161 [subsurface metagenome]